MLEINTRQTDELVALSGAALIEQIANISFQPSLLLPLDVPWYRHNAQYQAALSVGFESFIDFLDCDHAIVPTYQTLIDDLTRGFMHSDRYVRRSACSLAWTAGYYHGHFSALALLDRSLALQCMTVLTSFLHMAGILPYPAALGGLHAH